MSTPIVFLIDNGSLRPSATFSLRCLAYALNLRTGLPVDAVSLLHSHKVPSEDLGGEPATIVKRRLRECLAEGHRQFVFLPLFLGPSLAIVDYLPSIIEEARESHPDLDVRIAPVLSGEAIDSPDIRLSEILADQIRRLKPDGSTKVALVDHGTPIREVNHVRNAVAAQLAANLGSEVAAVRACSMERREGEEYAFNEPLLERLAEDAAFRGGRLILAMFFLLPGRHAGEGGDVMEIADGLKAAGGFDSIETTPLLGEHPRLLDLLEDRLWSVAERAVRVGT
jgi:sirohydrochlorin ferrochelatase